MFSAGQYRSTEKCYDIFLLSIRKYYILIFSLTELYLLIFLLIHFRPFPLFYVCLPNREAAKKSYFYEPSFVLPVPPQQAASVDQLEQLVAVQLLPAAPVVLHKYCITKTVKKNDIHGSLVLILKKSELRDYLYMLMFQVKSKKKPFY